MNRPDPRYVPTDLSGQATWFDNYNGQMQIVGASLGFASGELDRIKDDNTMVQFFGSSAASVEAYRGAMTSFRRVMLTGNIGEPNPDYPSAFAGLPLPTTGAPVDTGIWARLNKDVPRIRKAPTYTEETGALLGIIPTTPDAPLPGTVKPTASFDAAMHGYLFSTVVAGRQEADAFQVWIRREGTTDWTLAATATGKSVDVTYDPGQTSGPVQLQVYVQLRKDNANYGQPSEISLVTVNP